LQRLPVKAIKIDGSFIRAMNTEYSARTLVAAIASLAGKFGLTTVAESVERLSDFEDLRRFKVDLAQGFAIARPMSLAAFQDWLDAWPNRLIGSSEPRLPAKANPSRVVLLEDDVQMRCLLHEFLEEDGHKVNVAHDFAEAVALCKEREQPDLLVTDVHLNDSPSGLTLLEALRAEQPNLKALLISGGASLAKPYGKPGPDTPLLQKPFSRTDFLRQVRALLFEQS
jgi:CheY-like chemotaxis protein